MGDRDAISIDQKANLHLGTIRWVVSGVAFFGRNWALSLKVGRGEIIEEQREI